jgi:hypothetical protein
MEKSLKMPKGIQSTCWFIMNINTDKIPQIWFRVFMLTSKLLIQESHVAIGCLKRFLYQINLKSFPERLEDVKNDHRRIENTMITGKGDKKSNNDQLHTNDWATHAQQGKYKCW